MILTDDNFGTIVASAGRGRVIYSNIRKVVGFLLSCNFGEILVIFITSMILEFTPLPCSAALAELVTDSFPALALGRKRGGRHYAQAAAQKDRILDKNMTYRFSSGRSPFSSRCLPPSTSAASFLPRPPDRERRNRVRLDGFSSLSSRWRIPRVLGARTFAFVALILAEILRVFSSRSEYLSVFRQGFFFNATLNKAVLLSTVLTLLVVYIPFIDVYFKTIPLAARDWGILIVLILLPFFAGELYKKLYRRKIMQR